MKRLFTYIIFTLIICTINAESISPEWIDVQQRDTLYPQSSYFTGFASGSIADYKDKETAYERIQHNARVAAISSIHVTVEQTSEHYIQNAQSNGLVASTDVITSFSQSHSSIKNVPGLKVETWEDPQSKYIYAFAWVRISDLSKRLMRRIAANVSKIDTELQTVEALAKTDEKIRAKNNLPTIDSLLNDVEKDQCVMLCIDPSVTNEDLSYEDSQNFKNKYRTLSADLQNSITILLECQADVFGRNYPTLKGNILNSLSPIGCSLVTNTEEADWVIHVTAKAREHNCVTYGKITTYFAYVDSYITIDKRSTGQRIYEGQVSEKGGNIHNYEQAVYEAYALSASKINEIIKQYILQ